MRILFVLMVFICTLIFAVVGGLLVSLSLNLFSLQNLISFLSLLDQVENIRYIVGGAGLFLVIASISAAQLTLGKMQREKTIAFNNPDGQVTVSLSAIEDFIKRLSTGMAGIRNLRSSVIAGKKGIEIYVRASLWADANIPQTTEGIQAIIKNRIQEMLGIEEQILVRVHVGKIVDREKKRLKKKEEERPEDDYSPFRGNIEYGKE